MTDGFYVTVEGIDGSGTTSVVERLGESFPDAVETVEPTEMWTGRVAREAFEEQELPPISRFYYFQADRHAHAEEVVEPALESGQLIIGDRGPDSTRAYQRPTTPLSEEFIETCLDRTPEPDLTIWLDVPPDVASGRMGGGDAFENPTVQRKAAVEYMGIWKANDRIERVQADRSLDRVVDTCYSIIERNL